MFVVAAYLSKQTECYQENSEIEDEIGNAIGIVIGHGLVSTGQAATSGALLWFELHIDLYAVLGSLYRPLTPHPFPFTRFALYVERGVGAWNATLLLVNRVCLFYLYEFACLSATISLNRIHSHNLSSYAKT